jgi:hypothetical protein
MHLYGYELRIAFEAIVASAQAAPVLLFVAADADAICAARILVVSLTRDNRRRSGGLPAGR